jgi:WD40 repeat protein
MAVSGSYDGTVRLWDVLTGKQVCILGKHVDAGVVKPVRSVAVTPDGSLAISGGDDGRVRFWDLADKTELAAPESSFPHQGAVFSVAISPDGRTALSGSEDRTIKLWDTAKRQITRTFDETDTYVTSVAFSPNGFQAISGSAHGRIYLWDVPTGTRLRTFTGHADGPVYVAFGPDGNVALSGGGNHTMNLWALNNLEVRTLKGHTKSVNDIAFSSDGHMIVSGGLDKTAKVWDVATGKELASLSPNGPSDNNSVEAVGFAGCNVIVAGESMKLWDVLANQARTYKPSDPNFQLLGGLESSPTNAPLFWLPTTVSGLLTFAQGRSWVILSNRLMEYGSILQIFQRTDAYY